MRARWWPHTRSAAPATGSTWPSCSKAPNSWTRPSRVPPRGRHRPRLDRAWYGLGLTLIRLGRHDEAVKALERNTKLQPMSPYGWYQLARVHVDRQEPDEALKIIRHLKGFEPKVAAQLERETGLQA
jgi:tetratricopeptide (TPR) repeat protein